jgi:hypothetical protein
LPNDKLNLVEQVQLCSEIKIQQVTKLPIFISIFFCLTTLVTIALFYKASRFSKTTIIILLTWLVLQSVIALSGFYTVTNSIPPRFILLVAPPFIFITALFLTAKGKKFINNLDIKILTILHIVRVPVEIVLFWLFIHKAVPQLMTFEGRNFDILSGLTAPFIYYFGLVKNKISKAIFLFWNFICLALLVNIVVNAVLSAPFSFQQFAFNQPDIAVLFFPFVWLPCCIVPIVLFSHLASISQLIKGKAEKN